MLHIAPIPLLCEVALVNLLRWVEGHITVSTGDPVNLSTTIALIAQFVAGTSAEWTRFEFGFQRKEHDALPLSDHRSVALGPHNVAHRHGELSDCRVQLLGGRHNGILRQVFTEGIGNDSQLDIIY